VTSYGQVHAVLPLRWGEAKATPGGAPPRGSAVTFSSYRHLGTSDAGERQLEILARMLDQHGECATLRTHQVKLHLLSPAQAKAVADGNYQPCLDDAMEAFGGVSPPLWAVIYTDKDPGFFCFG